MRISPRATLEVPLTLDEISRVLRALASRVSVAIQRQVARARRAVAETLRPFGVAGGLVADMFRTRDELLAENGALRQQLIIASRKVKKPQFGGSERGLLVALASRIPAWRDAIFLSTGYRLIVGDYDGNSTKDVYV